MHSKTLKQFLDEYKPNDAIPSVATFVHFELKCMILPESGELRSTLDDIMAEHSPERVAEAELGRGEIENANSCEQIIRLMRRKSDPLNHKFIIGKAMEFESEVIPEVIRRFKTNTTTEFLEIATRVLAKSKMDIAEQLIGYFNDIRSPYAQSLALVVLGFKADEDRIPWFISKYHELKKKYPEENYHQGAYYGLWEMEMRFYADVNEKP